MNSLLNEGMNIWTLVGLTGIVAAIAYVITKKRHH